MSTRRWALRGKTVGSLLLVLVPLLTCAALVWAISTFYGLMALAFVGLPIAWVADLVVPGVVASVSVPDSVVRQFAAVIGVCATGTLAAGVYRGRQRASDDLLDEFVTAPATPNAQPVLCEAVSSVAQRLDCPEPEVVVAGPDAPTALSIGLTPEETTLLVSSRTLADLDAAELEAVVAHELAHVKNRDSTLKTFLMAPNAAMLGLTILVVPLFPVVALYWILVRLGGGTYARVREQAADHAAARVTGNPAALASALETLDEHTVDRPTTDARQEAVAALSIVPDPEEFHYGAERDIKPVVWPVQRPIRKAWMRATARHPRTETRIDALRRLERKQARR